MQVLLVFLRMRTARIQDCQDFMPSLSRASQVQEPLQAFVLWTMNRKKIEAGGVRSIVKPLDKPGNDKGIESIGDLLHIARDKRSDLLAGQECPRMPVQENQQIQITAVPDDREASE